MCGEGIGSMWLGEYYLGLFEIVMGYWSRFLEVVRFSSPRQLFLSSSCIPLSPQKTSPGVAIALCSYKGETLREEENALPTSD